MNNWKTVVIVTALSIASTACGRRTPIVTAPTPDPQRNAAVQAPPTEAPRPALTAKQDEKGRVTTQVANVQPPVEGNGRMTDSEREGLGERLRRLEDALFDYNEASIRPDASAALREDVAIIRNIMADFPADKLLIEGHADERGSSEYNLALANRRARAAQEFLSSMGIPPSQLTVVSLGEERPACTDRTESCWQQNRRAHITVAP